MPTAWLTSVLERVADHKINRINDTHALELDARISANSGYIGRIRQMLWSVLITALDWMNGFQSRDVFDVMLQLVASRIGRPAMADA